MKKLFHKVGDFWRGFRKPKKEAIYKHVMIGDGEMLPPEIIFKELTHVLIDLEVKEGVTTLKISTLVL